jgi:hypothetical protein
MTTPTPRTGRPYAHSGGAAIPAGMFALLAERDHEWVPAALRGTAR